MCLLSLSPQGQCETTPLQATDDNGTTFKLNVVKDQYLPPEMYGTWNIKATVIKSNAPPGWFLPYTVEMWTLNRENNRVTLQNIVNGASAQVTVDQVQGKTATFHRVARFPHERVTETPTITVDGNRISGFNRWEVVVLDRKDKPKSVFNVEIQLEGTRLANAKKTFGNPDPDDKPFEFEIAPFEHEN